MFVRALAILLLVIAGCGTGPLITSDAISDNGRTDAFADAAVDILTSDDGTDILAGDTNQNDHGDAASDTPNPSCESILKTWMCDGDVCPTGFFCSGFAPACAEAPCWGLYCDFIPGTCLPLVGDSPCATESECGPAYSCVKGYYSSRGLCTYTGGDGLCMSNSDCPGQMCAGEVISHISSAGHGPQFPGVCLDIPESGCWDDGMCVAGWCSGAVLCAPGDGSCIPLPGTCVDGPLPGCEPATPDSAFECEGSEWGNWCVGAEGFFNRWCAPPPASPVAGGQCWEDRECSPAVTGNLCRISGACPPRSFCRVTGFHSGICGPAPEPGEGLTLRFADQTTDGSVTLSRDSRAVLVNRGSVAIYVLPCRTLAVFVQKNGEWVDQNLEWGFSTAECGALPETTKLLLRVPPGTGLVLSMPDAEKDLFNEVLANRRIRLGLNYWLGCEPGGTTAGDMACLELSNGLGRVMYSPDVLWKPVGE